MKLDFNVNSIENWNSIQIHLNVILSTDAFGSIRGTFLGDSNIISN